jgi:hypothetical protein
LWFLWFYFVLYYCGLLKTKKNLNNTTNQYRSISEIHSVTISGRGILSHLWSTLAISNLFIAYNSNIKSGGFEEILLLLLPVFPSSIGPDRTTQFGTTPVVVSTFIHYTLISLYFLSSIVIFCVESAWVELSLQLLITIFIIIFHIKDHQLVILLEALAASCISVFYLRHTFTSNFIM